ncbi:MAG: hypothetical protein ACRDU8_04040, partial [Egibacteraceae bacterium]
MDATTPGQRLAGVRRAAAQVLFPPVEAHWRCYRRGVSTTGGQVEPYALAWDPPSHGGQTSDPGRAVDPA